MLKESRLLFLSLLFFSIANTSNSQNFQLLLDPITTVGTASIINLSIVNNSTYSGQVAISASLRTRRGNELLRQETTVDIVANGMTSVRGSIVNPQTTFIDAGFDQIYNAGSNLPPLNYVLCITANAISDAKIKSQECTEYSASDFVNILPLYPAEEAELYEKRPLFTWMDMNNQRGYSYNFRLVELEKGQNSNAALRRNSPIIIKNNLQENQLFFPSDAEGLKNNASYAWQVSLNYQGEEVATSEPWTFRYKEEDSLIEISRNLSYVDITELQSGVTLYAVGEFKFKYPSDIKNELTAELYVVKKKRKKKKELNENRFLVELGVNKFELDLKEQVYLKHLTDYQLILKDKKTKQSYQFTIKYVNPDYIK